MKLENLLNIKMFTIADEEYETTLSEDLQVDTESVETINVSLANQAKLVTMYGFAHEHALAHERKLEEDLEYAYAVLDSQARAAANAAGSKLTEKMVENTVKTDPGYIELRNKYLDAKASSGLLKAALKGIEQRKDTAVTIAHNLRSENKNNSYE